MFTIFLAFSSIVGESMYVLYDRGISNTGMKDCGLYFSHSTCTLCSSVMQGRVFLKKVPYIRILHHCRILLSSVFFSFHLFLHFFLPPRATLLPLCLSMADALGSLPPDDIIMLLSTLSHALCSFNNLWLNSLVLSGFRYILILSWLVFPPGFLRGVQRDYTFRLWLARMYYFQSYWGMMVKLSTLLLIF